MISRIVKMFSKWLNPVDWQSMSEKERQKIMASNRKNGKPPSRKIWARLLFFVKPKVTTPVINGTQVSGSWGSTTGAVIWDQTNQERQEIMQDNMRQANREPKGK